MQAARPPRLRRCQRSWISSGLASCRRCARHLKRRGSSLIAATSLSWLGKRSSSAARGRIVSSPSIPARSGGLAGTGEWSGALRASHHLGDLVLLRFRRWRDALREAGRWHCRMVKAGCAIKSHAARQSAPHLRVADSWWTCRQRRPRLLRCRRLAAGRYFCFLLGCGDGQSDLVRPSCSYLYGIHPHQTEAMGGLAPQGYLLIDGDDLVVPCSNAYPARLDLKTGALKEFELPSAGGSPAVGSPPHRMKNKQPNSNAAACFSTKPST